MNINKNLKYNNTSLLRLFYNGMARKFIYNNRSLYQNADGFEILNDNWPYTVDAYNEIVSDISDATKTYAYNKTDSKWYVKNDDDDYEQWGILSTVSSLSGVTTYTGKLVLLSTDNHEYKWNGNAWIDLGGYTQLLAAITSNAVTGDTSPAYKLTVNGTDFALSGLYHDIEVRLKFEKTPALIVSENGDDQYIFSSVTSPDSVEYLAFLSISSLYFDLAGSSRRCYTAFSNMSADTEYTFAFTNGHYLGTQYGYQNYMALWQDGTRKAYGSKGTSNNTNTLTQIASKYIDIYEIKIYDDNGLIFDLTPIDDNGTITFHDSVNNINATVLSGTPVGVYEETLPEEYPSKPAPTLTLSKNSYKEALSGSYINGQIVSIYNNDYAFNEKFIADETENAGYIRSSDPFYFDSGVSCVDNDISIEIKFAMKDLSQFLKSGTALYYANWSANGYLMMIGYDDSVSGTAFKWHYGTNFIRFGTRTTNTIVLKQDLTAVYIDGAQQGSSYTITNSYNGNIYFFKGISTAQYYKLDLKFYHIKIWKAGTLIKYYIVKNDSGTLRLYDKVNSAYPIVTGSIYDSFD